MASSSTAKSIEELTAVAMEEARERGLPSGWKVKFSGKQRRRKWISPGPNSRIYDSMPKALVAAGLLPPKTPDTDAGAGQKRSLARDDTPPVSFADDFVTFAAPVSGPSNVGATAATETESRKKKAKLGASLLATSNKFQQTSTNDGVNAETNTEDDPALVVASSKLGASSTSSLPEVSSAMATSDGCNNGTIDVDKKDLHLLSDVASSSNAASGPPTEELKQQPQVIVVEKEEEPTSDPESDPETSLDVNVVPSSPIKSLANDSPSSQQLSSQCLSPTKTVHWDPSTWEGRVIGSRVRVFDGEHDKKTSKWKMGRIVRFDPISRRHKIEFYAPDNHHIRDDDKKESSISGTVLGYEWLYLKDPEVSVVQIGTRFVWALVRGFAWWPAQVMVTIGNNLPKDMAQQAREGYVYVEFFGSDQVAVIKDLPEFVRPFNRGEVDAVIRKTKKKRDAAAIEIASAEENATINARNEAVRHLATKAFHLSNRSAGMCLGRRVQFFRDDVNYPYGEVVSGVVRRYSCLTKKWLVDYLPSATDDKATSYRALIASTSCSSSVNVPYPPSWVNLSDKKCDLKILPEEREWVEVTQALPKKKRKKSKKSVGTCGRTVVAVTMDDLAPFLYGYDDGSFTSDYVKKKCLACLRDTNPGGCLPHGSTNGEPDHAIVLTCHSCRRMFHPSCLDPPIAIRVARKIIEEQQVLQPNEDTDKEQVDGFWTCDKCTRCEGCHELDIVYGTRMYPKPVTITGLSCDSSVESSVQTTVKENHHPQLCSMCTVKYDDGQYCPNCGCTFDDVRYYKARRARLWRRRNIKKKAGFNSDDIEIASASLISSEVTKDGSVAVGADESSSTTELHSIVSKRSTFPDKDWFRSDSMVWGFNESSMLTCDSCHKWVHAGCARLTRDEYNLINQHKHPMYNAEFLCGNCCRERCQTLIKMLRSEDSMHLFAAPVTEEVAPNYRDVISHPMDLQTLANLMEKGDYNCSNYLWVKEYFELMVLNALVFNPPNSKYWNEAKRYHAACLGKVFNNLLTPAVARFSTKFSGRVHACYDRGQRELENEQDRKKSDETATKKDLVAGADVTSVQLLPLSKASDVPSCVPHAVVRFNNVDAHYTCWLDACFSCGSSGAADTMLFCVDCGEAYHSFCANAPIWSMDKVAMAAWRCPNCKLCEISADVPDDETKLLYCEMCDRAFRFDLLDPQLDFVPPGLWICGQCVDCASCKGDEPASLKFWSRDPRLCYGCGGCKGLVERKTKNMDCQVCGRLWRKSDHGVVKCSGCRLSVHVACDPYAKKYDRKGQLSGDGVPTDKGPSAGNGPTTLYKCPRCRKAKEKRKQELEREREAKKLCRQMKPKKTVQKVSTHELHRKLEDALEWQVKEMWRSEYMSIVHDASEMLKMANEYCDRILAPSDCLGTPEWMFPRAARWIRLAKRGSRLKSARQRRSGGAAHSVVTGHSAPLSTTNAAETCTEAPPSKEEHISVLVSRAKNASAFLFLTCRFFGVEMRTSVTCWKRAISMLTPPNEAGIVQLPHDNVKLEGGHIMEETKWRKAPVKVSGHLPQKLKEFSIQRRPLTQKPSKKVPKLQSSAISAATGTSISAISVPLQPPRRVVDRGVSDAASHPRSQSSNVDSSVVGKADVKSVLGCSDHGGSVSPGVSSQSKSVDGSRKVSFRASKGVKADSHAITFDEVSPLSVAKRSEVAPGNAVEQGSEKASSVSVSASDSVGPKHMSAKASPICPSKDAVHTTISVSQHKKANAHSGAPRSVRQQSLVVDDMTVKSASSDLEKKKKLLDNMSNRTACSDLETKPVGNASYSSSESSQKPEASGSSDRRPLYTRKVRHLNIPLASPMRGWGDGEVVVGDEIVQAKWADPRTCCLCHTCGDDDAGIPPKENAPSENVRSVSSEGQIGRAGRLLPMASGAWVHLSCALWSSEVWESADGAIHSVDKARYRGSKMKCFGCGRPGPTLGCSKVNCSVNYHFPCAGHCGAVFTSKQQMFCRNHRDHAPEVVRPERASFEHMKALRVVDREVLEPGESAPCFRIGTLVVHSLGTIEQDHDGFHSKHYITPPGYTASRIFWSFRKKRTRTLYIMRVDCSRHGEPIFSITAADDASSPIQGGTVEEVYETLIARVMKVNESLFSHGDLYSHLPRKRMRMSTYGLNGPQFFGFGLETTRRALELSPGVAAVAVPLSETSQTYDFCFTHPSKDDIMDLQRMRAAAAAEKALENMSGSARTEGMRAVDRSGGSGRITRALVKSADEDTSNKPTPDALVKDVEAGASNDINDTNQALYDEMKAVPLETRLAAKRSHIHGWGLFTKVDLPKHSMIIEYMGETIRQCVADKRERSYELSGIGSCYMFRLDANRIVDATMIGCMARFMNHCCRPNAYAKIITVETDSGFEKKIAVFANRNIASGEEITYDYKFPVEDGSLKCTCGAPNCIGRMN